jgi:hypothetical protein
MRAPLLRAADVDRAAPVVALKATAGLAILIPLDDALRNRRRRE